MDVLMVVKYCELCIEQWEEGWQESVCVRVYVIVNYRVLCKKY